ncbi:hypothetical protein HanLR1_Chr00c1552g0809361 [Helianthus annuus]|nr:hypothetical protein HanLR1_Chr00c1552g0809361 [Helianthus annuus]
MIKKNPALTEIPGNNRTMPLYMAALFAKPDMVRHLYGISNKMGGDYWSTDNRGWVLQNVLKEISLVSSSSYFFLHSFTGFICQINVTVNSSVDVAIQIVNDCPELCAKKGPLLTDVLLALAQKPKAFKRTKAPAVFRIINSGKYMLFALFSLFNYTLEFGRINTHYTCDSWV